MKLFDRLTAIVMQLTKVLENLNSAIRDASKREHGKNKLSGHVTAEIRFPKEVEDAQTSAQDEQIRIQRRIARWTALAFIAAAIYAGISWKQLVELRRQTDAIKDQFRVDQQSWLKFGVDPKLPTLNLVSGKQIYVDLKMVNIGKSPAFKIQATTIVEKHAMNERPSFDSQMNKNVFTAGVLFPTDDFAYPARSEFAVSEADINDWKEGNIYVLIYGFVNYLDMFNAQHTTWFCQSMIGKVPMTIPTRVCAEKYNQAH